MTNLKVIKVDSDYIEFDNGIKLSSDHEHDCCEHHYIDFSDLKIEDFNGLEFNLSDDGFFKRIPNYGIELTPLKGWSIKVPGYGSNNGYYGSNIDLVLTDKNKININTFDISDCQDWNDQY